MQLPTINGTNPQKINEFYEKLVTHVNTLDTMGKLQSINGYVRFTLDKLAGVRGDLVRTDDNWQNWEFREFIEALKKWTERNPVNADQQKELIKRDKLLQARQGIQAKKECVSESHKVFDCDKVKDISQRRKIVSTKKLCYNCLGEGHRAIACKSKRSCKHCNSRHHTTICEKGDVSSTPTLTTQDKQVIHPTVIVKVNGIKCRALLDTGAGSAYASATIIDKINKRPVRTEYRNIEMMMHTTTKHVKIYQVEVSDVEGNHSINVEVSKVDKSVLISIPNPNYQSLCMEYDHLKDITINDIDTKNLLPVHIVLGASEYARIKTKTAQKLGQPGEPVAEKTKFGWTIISPGQDFGISNLCLARSSATDYDNLCKLDVLGLEDENYQITEPVYDRFKEQLKRSSDGWYETGLLWKSGKDSLLSNKTGSIGRLQKLVKRLKKDPELFAKYDNIIQEQLNEGIVEIAPTTTKGTEFYLPHHPVVRKEAETTKVRVVYDGSARENQYAPSLNDCLETGPPLHNLIWDILLRTRLNPIIICGDVRQAFLQIRIREQDRDALRFHWLLEKKSNQLQVLRFTRAIFGLVQSPFFLNGTIKVHLEKSLSLYPSQEEQIRDIAENIYVDDIITGGAIPEVVSELKETAIATFKDAGFKLHKWKSNIPELENEPLVSSVDLEQTYAKHQLGSGTYDTKILGVTWDKTKDEIGVTFPAEKTPVTKRGILQKLASIYDPLGIASPITLYGKIIYRETCDLKIGWDKELPAHLAKKWFNWIKRLGVQMKIPRCIGWFKEPIKEVELHAFADASNDGVSAALYAVVHQMSGTNQGLLGSKSRLSKKNLTIPRLELVAAHMATKLLDSAKQALRNHHITGCFSWTDSTVVLHWIREENGQYKQFVSNRVSKIQEKKYVSWRFVPTTENCADVGSRGCFGDKLPTTWLTGPSWLTQKRLWPENIITTSSPESINESKVIRTVLKSALTSNDSLNNVKAKFNFRKSMRITSWILRFLNNCRKRTHQLTGPLSTTEIQAAVDLWIVKIQREVLDDPQHKQQKEHLNLVKNEQGIVICKGRIQGFNPIYLPRNSNFKEKIVMDAHLKTLHGGVGSTMTEVRRKYWVPKLRQLTKRLRHACHGCKRFQATAFQTPIPGLLPTDRTEGSRAFQVIGTDYAGPIIYKLKSKKEAKAYILIFTCSLSRAIHLELLTDQTVDGFIRSFKRFTARRGNPSKIYSDNAKTFKAAAKWLTRIIQSENLHEYLSREDIKWQFNLSRAPWWGGQFERIIGIVKQSIYKSIGKSLLSFKELEEILLDVEQCLNNRPLMYNEEDLECPVLTPNSLVFGQENYFPTEDDPANIDEKVIRKRQKYIISCKEAVWKRWSQEYLKSLREKHDMRRKSQMHKSIKLGDVVLIKGDNKNRGKWNIGIVTKLFKGKDDEIRAVELRAGRDKLERAIQHLYPLELSCDVNRQPHDPLNVNANEFRPRRNAAAIAELRMKDQATADREEPYIE